MGATWFQFFPPAPELTEKDLGSLQGKVFIVTGGSGGIGYEICRLLYAAGGKVYLAGRSEEKANAAMSRIKSTSTTSAGELTFLYLSLDDLTTIKPAAEKFMTAETRLDVLFNNAGVSNPPVGSVGAQGAELQMATNCLGPYLLTQLLVPILVKTAKTTSLGSTRVIWTSSIATDVGSAPGGIDLEHLSKPPPKQQLNYATSKTGNWFLADALARQIGGEDHGVLSVTLNPGNLKSDLARHLPGWVPIVFSPLLHQTKYGAYTNLWAAFSPKLSLQDGGKYIIPWGRLHPAPRQDILDAFKSKEEGGSGVAAAFVEWCSKQTLAFA